MSSPTSFDLHQTLNIQLTPNSITLLPVNKTHKYCLIFLHGYGMPINRFLNLFLSPELLPILDDFKIFIPQAPKGQIDDNPPSNSDLFSWYNRSNESTLHRTVDDVKEMIRIEAELLENDTTKIFLGGFSQGGFVTLYTSHILEERLGGVILIAGFMSKVVKTLPEKNDLSPTILIHGLQDETTKWENAKNDLKQFLEKPNVQVVLVEDMKHDVYHPEVRIAIRNFLNEKKKIIKPHL